MPTYQYACTECDARLEAVQSFSDDALTECPQCHGRLRKVFSAVGVVFKGSGFYRTDSRSGSSSSAPGSGSEPKSGSGDAKPADKPAVKAESSTPAASPAKKADSAA